MCDDTSIAVSTAEYKSWTNDIENDIWKGSKFEKLKKTPSPRARGAMAERLLKQILIKKGCKITKPKSKSSEYDLHVNGLRVEVKMSTLWNSNESSFKWQQIRNQEYDLILFMAVYPNELKIWGATKETIRKEVFGKDELRQHAGKNGKQELYWISDQQPWFVEDYMSLLGGTK